MGQVDITNLFNPNDPIDKELIALAERCPILLDEDFLKQHPKIWGAIGFLDAAASHFRGNVYEQFGVKTTEEYVKLIQQGNEKVIAHYKKVNTILGL